MKRASHARRRLADKTSQQQASISTVPMPSAPPCPLQADDLHEALRSLRTPLPILTKTDVAAQLRRPPPAQSPEATRRQAAAEDAVITERGGRSCNHDNDNLFKQRFTLFSCKTATLCHSMSKYTQECTNCPLPHRPHFYVLPKSSGDCTLCVLPPFCPNNLSCPAVTLKSPIFPVQEAEVVPSPRPQFFILHGVNGLLNK